jgi:hypothetical protein
LFTIYILNKLKKRFFEKKLIGNIQTFITKKVLNFFFFFLYSVQGAQCGNRRKFHADRRIFKHCKKSAKVSDGFPTRRRERVNWTLRPARKEGQDQHCGEGSNGTPEVNGTYQADGIQVALKAARTSTREDNSQQRQRNHLVRVAGKRKGNLE